MSARKFWLNGEFVEGDAPERGLEGVFDTMLAVQGEAQYLDDHMARLTHDIEIVLGAAWIPAFAGMPDIIKTLSQEMDFARVRTSVTRKMVLIEVFPCADPATLGPTTAVIVEDWPRVVGDPLENCKRLDYSRNLSARDKALAMGADNAIMLNTQGRVACGHVANVFIEEDGVLITPPLREGVLAGITRQKILDGTFTPHPNPPPLQGGREQTREGFGWGVVKEEPITTERLIAADKAFLTNSLIGLRPTLLR